MSALRALARRRFEDREPPALTGEAAASARAVVPVREPAGIGADDALWSEIQARRAIRDAIASVRRMSYELSEHWPVTDAPEPAARVPAAAERAPDRAEPAPVPAERAAAPARRAAARPIQDQTPAPPGPAGRPRAQPPEAARIDAPQRRAPARSGPAEHPRAQPVRATGVSPPGAELPPRPGPAESPPARPITAVPPPQPTPVRTRPDPAPAPPAPGRPPRPPGVAPVRVAPGRVVPRRVSGAAARRRAPLLTTISLAIGFGLGAGIGIGLLVEGFRPDAGPARLSAEPAPAAGPEAPLLPVAPAVQPARILRPEATPPPAAIPVERIDGLVWPPPPKPQPPGAAEAGEAAAAGGTEQAGARESFPGPVREPGGALGGSADQVRPTGAEAPGPTGGARVFVHYPTTDPAARSAALGVAHHLARDGFTVADLRPVGFPVRTSSVRYFFGDDRADAAALAASVRRWLAGNGRDVAPVIQDFTTYQPKPRAGNLELWVGA